MESALGGLQDVGVEMANGDKLCDLTYADVLVWLFQSTEHAERAVNKLESAVVPFGICFTCSKCKVL